MTDLKKGVGIKTVFVIDDDPDVRDVLSQLLVEYRTYCFSTGDKAVDWMKRNSEIRPDFVMSDCVMPGMTGVETLRQIRTIAPEARLILMSAAVPDELEHSVMENNFDGFIANPFTATEGDKMINEALAARGNTAASK